MLRVRHVDGTVSSVERHVGLDVELVTNALTDVGRVPLNLSCTSESWHRLNSRISYLLEVWQQAIPSPTVVAELLPGVEVCSGASGPTHSIHDRSTTDDLSLVNISSLPVQEGLGRGEDILTIAGRGRTSNVSRDDDPTLAAVTGELLACFHNEAMKQSKNGIFTGRRPRLRGQSLYLVSVTNHSWQRGKYHLDSR